MTWGCERRERVKNYFLGAVLLGIVFIVAMVMTAIFGISFIARIAH